MDCSLPGSSVHGIFQTRILEWVAISFSRGSSGPGDQISTSGISCIGHLGSPVNHYKTTGNQAWQESEQSGPSPSETVLEADWEGTPSRSPVPPVPLRAVFPWMMSTCAQGSQGQVLCRNRFTLSPPSPRFILFSSYPHPLWFSSPRTPNLRPICISTASQSLIWKFTGDPFHIPCDSLEGHSSGPKIRLSTEKSDAHPEGTPRGSLKT